jgi:hypothetical protein
MAIKRKLFFNAVVGDSYAHSGGDKYLFKLRNRIIILVKMDKKLQNIILWEEKLRKQY